MNDQLFYIWSWEHDAWWAPHEQGYVGNIKDAGKYTYQQALEICLPANYSFTYFRAHPNEGMVPVPKEHA